MMTHDKKLAFIHKMTKMGLDSIPHFDSGGVVPGALVGGGAGAITGGFAGANGLLPQIPSVQGTGIAGIASNALGLNNDFRAGAAPITQGTNATQLSTAYGGAQAGLTDQQDLVKQTHPGVVQGLDAQSQLSGQLSDQAAGRGPNPALSALQASTGNNIQQQAALAAGQRGAGANAGMIAANNAQQGAQIQQNAVGQAATLQAQQQLAAQQAQQQLAATQVGQNAGAIQGENQQQQNEQNILQGANNASNTAGVSQQSNLNTTNANVASGNQAAAGNVFGGLMSGASSALASMFAHGGTVPKMANGGYMAPTPLAVANPSGPQSFVGQWINSSVPTASAPIFSTPDAPMKMNDLSKSMPGGGSKKNAPMSSGPGENGTGQNALAGANGTGGMNAPMRMLEAHGGKIPKMLPPMSGKNLQLVSKGGAVKGEGKGQKAVTKGDSYANDTVPAMLSAGEVVIDKDTLHDSGPIGEAARMVAQHISMKNKGHKRV